MAIVAVRAITGDKANVPYDQYLRFKAWRQRGFSRAGATIISTEPDPVAAERIAQAYMELSNQRLDAVLLRAS